MITITYKDKTYKMQEPFPWFEGTIDVWLENGTLVEVKENKETRTFTIGFDEYEAIKKNASILKKLRSELRKRIKDRKDPYYSDTVVTNDFLIEAYTALLTSLEQSRTKEEQQTNCVIDCSKPQQNIDSVTTTASTAWQPTPGQMIGVSNDGEKWEKRKFHEMNSKTGRYVDTNIDFWKFARPITEEVIDHDLVKENIRVMDEQDGYSEVIVPEQKPSERIDEIAHEIAEPIRNWGTPNSNDKWEALMRYLDEQWIHSQSNK